MKLPSRIVDLSSPLDNETVYDYPFMRPKIQYRSNADTAPLLCDIFPGLRVEDLPDGEGWAIEQVQLTTHNGTHMDAPIHFQSKSIDGKPMLTIDQVPLLGSVPLIGNLFKHTAISVSTQELMFFVTPRILPG